MSLSAVIAALVSALNALPALASAFASWVRWRQQADIYADEDEEDSLAADGSPAAKLRLERVAKRLAEKRKLIGLV